MGCMEGRMRMLFKGMGCKEFILGCKEFILGYN